MFGRVGVVFKKELLETLRDRRTLFVMVLLPILLYPLIFLALGAIMESHLAELSTRPVRVAVWGSLPDEIDDAHLAEALQGTPDAPIERVEWVPPEGMPDPDGIEACDRAAAGLLSESVDVVLVMGRDVPCRPDGRPVADVAAFGRVDVMFDGAHSISQSGARRVADAIGGMADAVLRDVLSAASMDRNLAEPFRIDRTNLASEQRMGGHFAGTILPLVLVLMVIMGAFYPAIDLTAGEKERGTLESLISSPVRPSEIVAGKYLTVVTISMIAATVNLASMGLTLNRMTAGLAVGGTFALTFGGALTILLLLLPTALFFSALMLAMATLARDFKEAQNYLTPAFMVCIVPAALAGLPGVELNTFTALAPGINIALVIKEVLGGQEEIGQILLVMIANGVYAALTLRLASRLFTSEYVLFGTGRGWKQLFAVGAAVPAARPSTTAVAIYFASTMAALYHIASMLQARDLIGGLLWTQYGLLLAPALIYAYVARLDFRATFHLRLPTARGWIGTVLVAVSAWSGAVLGAMLLSQVLPGTREFAEAMREALGKATADLPTAAVFAVFAVSPAICEEAVFRGVILSGVRSRYGRGASVIIVGCLFGAFHLSLHRFVPTAILGMVITYAVWQTGSILSAAVIHFSTNAIIFAADRTPELAESLGFAGDEIAEPGPLAVALVITALGLYILSREKAPDVPARRPYSEGSDAAEGCVGATQ